MRTECSSSEPTSSTRLRNCEAPVSKRRIRYFKNAAFTVPLEALDQRAHVFLAEPNHLLQNVPARIPRWDQTSLARQGARGSQQISFKIFFKQIKKVFFKEPGTGGVERRSHRFRCDSTRR